MRHYRRFFYLFFSLALIAGTSVLTGCDSDSDDDGNGGPNGNPNTGSFEVEITGDGIDLSFSGIAVFGEAVGDEEDDFGFVVWMAPTATGAGTSNVVALYTDGSRPGTGSYSVVDTIDDEDPLAGSFAAIAIGNNAYFIGTGGTVSISSSSSTRVAGSFNVTGVSLTGGEGGIPVTIQGSFNAVSSGNIIVPF